MTELDDKRAPDDGTHHTPPKEVLPDDGTIKQIREVVKSYLEELGLPNGQRNLPQVVGQNDFLQRYSSLDILTAEQVEALKQNKSALAKRILFFTAIHSHFPDKKVEILEWILQSEEPDRQSLELVLNYLSRNSISEEIDAHLVAKAKFFLRKQRISSWEIGFIIAKSGRFPELTELLESQLKNPRIPEEIRELIVNNAAQLFPEDWQILLQEQVNLEGSPRLRLCIERALKPKPTPEPTLSDCSDDFKEYEDKFRAALLGHAIGDAYGNALEILKKAEMPDSTLPKGIIYPRTQYSYEEQGTTTDDTVLVLLLLQNFIKNQGFSPESYASTLGEYQNKVDLGQAPPRHFSTNTMSAFRRVNLGYSLDRSGRPSYGNGSILRCLPLAMITMKTEEGKKAALIEDTVRFTHNNENAFNAAKIVVKIQQHLFKAKELDVEALLDLIQTENTDEKMATKIELVRKHLHDNEASQEAVQTSIGTASTVYDTLPFALYCFARAKDFDELMKACSYVDGDSDSVAALAGSFWGALHGTKGIPETYTEQLDCRDHIERAIKLQDGEYWA